VQEKHRHHGGGVDHSHAEGIEADPLRDENPRTPEERLDAETLVRQLLHLV